MGGCRAAESRVFSRVPFLAHYISLTALKIIGRPPWASPFFSGTPATAGLSLILSTPYPLVLNDIDNISNLGG